MDDFSVSTDLNSVVAFQLYPPLQRHSKDPRMLKQLELSVQLPLLSSHALISKITYTKKYS